jgi:hypothetical protein
MTKYEPLSDLATVKELIAYNLSRNTDMRKQKPVFIDGERYASLFDAGINSGISYVAISQGMTRTSGAPTYIKGRLVVLESWIHRHPEYIAGVAQ